VYENHILAFKKQCGIILSRDNFHHVNLCARDEGATRLVSNLVRLDRLPGVNPPEGMRLLRTAWRHFDIALHLAWKYKLIGKVLFFAELLVAFFIFVVSTAGDTLVFGDWAATPEGNNIRGDLVFALSLLVSALYSVDSLIQARSRWRALRSSAGELESMIWRYRTRVEPFTVGSTTQNTGPEWAFNRAIAEWIDELASAANLATTDMVRSYPASVYRHHQDVISNNPPVVYLEGGIKRPVTLDVDDFHSPTKPDMYIELRLRPQMEFYRWRVPVYHRWAAFYRAALLLSASIMSALSYYRVEKWVIVITAFSAAITAWVESADITSKVRRYTSAVHTLEKLLMWWDTLGEVDKAGVENVCRLIEHGEAAINSERLAWQSTGSKPTTHGDTKSGDHGDRGGDVDGERKGNRVHPSAP